MNTWSMRTMFPHGLTAGLRGMCSKRKSGQATRFGLIPICVATIFLSTAIGQSTPQSQSSLKAASAEATASSAKTSPYHPQRFPKRATDYYGLVWGVDSLSVKWAESGEIIRFSYRVLDADKAKVLNDKKNEPSLVCPRAGVKLVVPSLEKVGQLRQSAPPEAGKAYWMAFSNKGRPVKRGDRVSIVIGQFRADGLVVD